MEPTGLAVSGNPNFRSLDSMVIVQLAWCAYDGVDISYMLVY
jgi:hypothetical protein